MRFLFGLNTVEPVTGHWSVLGYHPALRLTNPHMFTGYDEIRDWLKERGLPFSIDGVTAEQSTVPVDLQTQGIPRPMGRTYSIPSSPSSFTLVLVEVADEIALHFKLRWC